jgi:hypothetical protein
VKYNLPSEAKYDKSVGLKWGDTKIANIVPSVGYKIKLHTDNGSESWFRLNILNEEDKTSSENK